MTDLELLLLPVDPPGVFDHAVYLCTSLMRDAGNVNLDFTLYRP